MAYIGASGALTNQATAADVFSGNGSNTQFTLSRTVYNTRDIEVVVNNVQQNPFDGSYSVSGQTLTLSGAPTAGANNIYVNYQLGIIGAVAPTDNSVTANSLSNTAITGKLGYTPANKAGDTFNGNVAINGTTSVVATSPYLSLGNGSELAKLYWDNNTNNFELSQVYNGPMLFKTNNTERVRVAANGNIGINNTAPGYLLSVNGPMNIQGSGYIRMTDQTGGGSGTDFWIGHGGMGGGSLAFYAPGGNVLEFGTNNNAYMTLATNALTIYGSTNIYNAAGRPILRQSGSIIQVQSYTKTDAYISSGTSAWSTPTNFQVTITPTSTSSKILITGYVSGAGSVNTFGRLRRNGTVIGVGDAAGSRTQATSGSWFYNGDSNTDKSMPFMYVDSPATTSAITYDFQLATPEGAQTFAVNRSINDSDIAGRDRSISTIVVMEIAQ